MNRPSAVIWDFNGTILNDVELAASAVSTLMVERGMTALTSERHRSVFQFPIVDYYRALGFDMDAEDHNQLADEFHVGYLNGVADCSMNEGVQELLDTFKDRGADQFVLSAAEQTMLVSWVRMLGIESYFKGIYGLTDRLAGGKSDRGQALVDDFALNPGSTLFIGDTDHDVEVARETGCRPIVVLQGHQPPERINGATCEVFDTFGDLLEAVREIR